MVEQADISEGQGTGRIEASGECQQSMKIFPGTKSRQNEWTRQD